jgi:hypothetical protein
MNISVAHSQTAKMSRPPEASTVPGSIPRATSSAQCSEKRRMETRELIVSVARCVIG